MKKHLLTTSLFVFALIVASTQMGQAGVLSFIHGCVDNIGDFSQLGARLEASGMKEIDPTKGPRSPVGSGSPQQQRLWQGVRLAPGMIDEFTGYSMDSVGFPAEICFHVSRPGESALVALRELKNRFPPIGQPVAGAYFTYGGREHWEARIEGKPVIIGVVWPNKDLPDQGSSELYLIKPRNSASEHSGKIAINSRF
jgi:hypothetical protein